MYAPFGRGLPRWKHACQKARQLLASEGDAAYAERILQAYQLDRAGSTTGCERGGLARHPLLAIRPDGQIDHGALRGAQSVYPFNRRYIYSQEIACSTNSNPALLPT